MDIQIIKKLALPILKKHGVIRAAIFGSAVRNEMTKDSDIDIVAELPHTVHGFDYVALKIDLQEDLESALSRKVDLIEYSLIKPELKKYILPTQLQIL